MRHHTRFFLKGQDDTTMTTSGSSTRTRRVTATTMCAVTAAALLPAAHAQTDSTPIKAADSCATVHLVFANGTFDSTVTDNPNEDTGFFGGVYDQISKAVDQSGLQGTDGAPAVSRSYVNYHAAAGGALLPGVDAKYAVDSPTYRESMQGGVDEAIRQISEVADNCDDTKFMLSGYSQGAEVIENVARRIGNGDGPVDPDRIAGVSLFASPTRQAEEALHVGGGDSVPTGDATTEATTGLQSYPTPDGGGLSFDKTGTEGFGQLGEETVSWCLNGDLVCGLPVESEAIRLIVDGAEDADLTDPVTTLTELSEGISQAMVATDISDSDASLIDFGEGGFNLKSTSDGDEDATAQPGTTAGSEETDAAEGSSPSSSTPAPQSSGSSGSSTPAPQQGPSPLQPFLDSARGTSAELEAGDDTSSDMFYDLLDGGAELMQDALPELPPVPRAEEGTVAAEVQNVGDRLMPALTEIGGMALGAAVTTTKRTLTPENMAQIAAAGVTAGPEAAGAVTMARFAEEGQVLLQPEYASIFTRRAMNSMAEHELVEGDIADMAVTLANWQSLNEHAEYSSRSMMPDGRTAVDATVDWVVASALDAGADGDSDTSSSRSDNGIVGPLGESILDVDYDTDAANDALSSLLTETAGINE